MIHFWKIKCPPFATFSKRSSKSEQVHSDKSCWHCIQNIFFIGIAISDRQRYPDREVESNAETRPPRKEFINSNPPLVPYSKLHADNRKHSKRMLNS